MGKPKNALKNKQNFDDLFILRKTAKTLDKLVIARYNISISLARGRQNGKEVDAKTKGSAKV